MVEILLRARLEFDVEVQGPLWRRGRRTDSSAFVSIIGRTQGSWNLCSGFCDRSVVHGPGLGRACDPSRRTPGRRRSGRLEEG